MTSESIMLLGLFVFLALALTIITFVFRMTILSMISAGAWLVCTALGWVADQLLDAEMGLPVGSIAGLFLLCMIVMIASAWFLRKPKEPELPYSHTDRQRDYYRRIMTSRRRWRED